jgi:hypothetical protein
MYSHQPTVYIKKNKRKYSQFYDFEVSKPHIYTCEVVKSQTHGTVNICRCFRFAVSLAMVIY